MNVNKIDLYDPSQYTNIFLDDSDFIKSLKPAYKTVNDILDLLKSAGNNPYELARLLADKMTDRDQDKVKRVMNLLLKRFSIDPKDTHSDEEKCHEILSDPMFMKFTLTEASDEKIDADSEGETVTIREVTDNSSSQNKSLESTEKFTLCESKSPADELQITEVRPAPKDGLARSIDMLNHLLRSLGVNAGFNKNNTCVLLLDGEIYLHITYSPGPGRLYLYTTLGEDVSRLSTISNALAVLLFLKMDQMPLKMCLGLQKNSRETPSSDMYNLVLSCSLKTTDPCCGEDSLTNVYLIFILFVKLARTIIQQSLTSNDAFNLDEAHTQAKSLNAALNLSTDFLFQPMDLKLYDKCKDLLISEYSEIVKQILPSEAGLKLLAENDLRSMIDNDNVEIILPQFNPVKLILDKNNKVLRIQAVIVKDIESNCNYSRLRPVLMPLLQQTLFGIQVNECLKMVMNSQGYYEIVLVCPFDLQLFHTSEGEPIEQALQVFLKKAMNFIKHLQDLANDIVKAYTEKNPGPF